MIRKYQTEDTETLISIWQPASALAHAFLPDSFTVEEAVNMRDIYLPNAETWVFVEDGVPIGFIALIDDEIGGLFLCPSHHGQGIGKAMVDHAVNLKGILRVEVFEQNSMGRRFYDRYGFVETGRYQHEGSGEMTLKMILDTAS